MCLGVNRTIGRDLTLREARSIARNNQGSEAIIKQDNNKYTVTQLSPEDVTKAQTHKEHSFAASNVEFMVQKPNGTNEVVINEDASFFNRAKSKVLNAEESAIEMVTDFRSSAEQARSNIMNAISTLSNNLTDRTNSYIFGGKTNFNLQKGVSNVDCSGLLNNVYKAAGLDLPAMGTGQIDAYIKDGKGILKETTKGAQIKPGDVVNYPGHVMIAAGEPSPVTENGKVTGYRLNVFDSSSDNSGTRRSGELGKTGAGFREIVVFVDGTDKISGINNMGNARTGQRDGVGGYHEGVRIGTLKDNVRVNKP